MKLRIKGNSIRLRVDRKDLATLIERGRVEEALRFGPGADSAFVYALELGEAPRGGPSATYHDGALTARLDRRDAEEWAGDDDRVGFERLQEVDGGGVRILIEKDFGCLDRPAGHDDDAHAFPNPSASC